MLQLINNGNLLIHPGKVACNGFHLELVTTELVHKQMGISGSLGFHCNNAALPAASQGEENVDANLQQAADDGRSPAYKAARTGAAGRARAKGARRHAR